MSRIIIELKGRRFELSGSDEEIRRILFLAITALTKGETTKDTEIQLKLEPPQKMTIPSFKEVLDYIKGKPHYEHSYPEVSNHFLGYVAKWVEDLEERKKYDHLYARVNIARKTIEVEEPGGEWIPTPKNRVKIYRYVKRESAMEGS